MTIRQSEEEAGDPLIQPSLSLLTLPLLSSFFSTSLIILTLFVLSVWFIGVLRQGLTI
jgi:hypothetical protein